MAKSRSDQMVERLRNMQAAAPDIEASAVVSVDGLIMASACNKRGRGSRFGHVSCHAPWANVFQANSAAGTRTGLY